MVFLTIFLPMRSSKLFLSTDLFTNYSGKRAKQMSFPRSLLTLRRVSSGREDKKHHIKGNTKRHSTQYGNKGVKKMISLLWSLFVEQLEKLNDI